MTTLSPLEVISEAAEQLVVDDELLLQRAVYNNNDEYYSMLCYAIMGVQEGRRLGSVELYKRRNDSIMLGYGVHDDAQGKQVATRAASRLVDFGFEDWGLTRVVLTIAPGNRASQRVARKLGAQLIPGYIKGYEMAGYDTWLIERPDRG